jgi:mRNA interferase ChpB
MVRRVKYERGDIVNVNLEPTIGREQKGEHRPALVLSTSVFNVMGLVMIAPITQGGDFARHAGFAVPLTGAGTKTQGIALVNQIRMMDLEQRGAKKIETAPDFVIEDALARLQAILD